MIDAAGRAFSKRGLFKRLEYEPHELQEEVHSCKAPRRVVAWGVRGGKTRSAAMEAIAGALEPSDALHPRRGWVVAPDYTLADKAFREIVLIARERLPFLIREDKEHVLVLSNLGGGFCEVRAKTAENPTALLGEGLDWLIVDEAARLKPDIWDRYLSARLIDKKGWALLISTPRGKGWYYDAWRRGQGGDPTWKSWRAPTWANPHIDRKEVEAVRSKIPEAVFRQEYEAEFLEGAGQVFRNIREFAVLQPAAPIPGEDYCAGLDLARINDYTVLVIMDSRRRVVHWDRFTRVDWKTQVGRIATVTKRYNGAMTLVDSTGAGEPVYETLLEAGVRCEGYPFTTASKSALVNNLALLLEQGEIRLPTALAWPELVDELEAFEYTVTDGGTVRTGAPPGMHDDCVCALMLAAWEARERGSFEAYEL